MKIQILCDNPGSWIVVYAKKFKEELKEEGVEVSLLFKHSEVSKGDILILLSCEKIFKKLSLNKFNLVIHESDLPQGKGWSPLTWQILEGKNIIPITLFEATEKVDAGLIYNKEFIHLCGTELIEEIREKQANATFNLIRTFVASYPNVNGENQKGEESFYPRRTVKNSELDINKSIAEQFNLLRVCDNERYPAYFKINDKKYIIKIYQEH